MFSMKQSNANQKYSVKLVLRVLSEERDGEWLNIPLIELEFSKKTDLPCPPFVGLHISGLWHPIPIDRVIVHGDQIICELEQLVAPKENIL